MPLIDRFGRVHNYLRISLTPHCNFSCTYCMPEGVHRREVSKSLMTKEEIDAIVKIFCALGVTKIRLTGGEPLVRKDADQIIESLAKYPVEIVLTTNGARLHAFLPSLEKAGVQSINISLDSLREERFNAITKTNHFKRVWSNIGLMLQLGYKVKINTVVMRGVNDDELLDFVALTRHHGMEVRFIEFMPFGGNQWQSEKVIPQLTILERIGRAFDFLPVPGSINDTASHYRIDGFKGSFATISTMSNPFCSGCNRLRLTADGKLKNCLFSVGETDLLTAFRNGKDIVPLIEKAVFDKAAVTGGQINKEISSVNPDNIRNRSMIDIGG